MHFITTLSFTSRLGILAISLALLNACGDRTPPAPPPDTNQVAPPSSMELTQMTPEQLEAESSLSVKRGIVTLTDATRLFRACGSNGDSKLTDQTDGLLDRVYAELSSKPMYVEAYGERAVNGDFVMEEMLYATSSGIDTRCAAQTTRFELLARGNEPTWSVEITQDAMVLKQTGAPTEIRFTEVDTADAEGTVTYRAGVDKHVLELTVTQQACHDAASGEYFGYAATAKLDKQTFNGCARVGG
jgi:uncharacterized membrane protein